MQKVKLNNIEKQDFRTRESYKTLRTNLEFAGKKKKVTAVTSCTPNEGKSSVSFQLALSMAESGKRVVLVDADMRKSVLRSLYHVSAARYGLSHYLSGQASLSDVLCETNVPDFYVVFAGPVPPNPSELLGGEAFGLMLDYLRREYDYVVVDTPPLGRVIDGAVIAGQCDGAVLVIESGAVSYRFAQSVKEQLDRAGCSVLGVVLNKVSVGSRGYYGNYYGKYYGKYYGTYGEEEEGGLNDAVGREEAGRWERPQSSRNEKAAGGRGEKPSAGRSEKGGKPAERGSRTEKKDRAAARKAARGEILVLDEEEMDFVTLGEEAPDGEAPQPEESAKGAEKSRRAESAKGVEKNRRTEEDRKDAGKSRKAEKTADRTETGEDGAAGNNGEAPGRDGIRGEKREKDEEPTVTQRNIDDSGKEAGKESAPENGRKEENAGAVAAAEETPEEKAREEKTREERRPEERRRPGGNRNSRKRQ